MAWKGKSLKVERRFRGAYGGPQAGGGAGVGPQRAGERLQEARTEQWTRRVGCVGGPPWMMAARALTETQERQVQALSWEPGLDHRDGG